MWEVRGPLLRPFDGLLCCEDMHVREAEDDKQCRLLRLQSYVKELLRAKDMREMLER
jgi:hypothetical protein